LPRHLLDDYTPNVLVLEQLYGEPPDLLVSQKLESKPVFVHSAPPVSRFSQSPFFKS